MVDGNYFDATDTPRTLARHDAATRLTMQINCRAATPFNWYAHPLARLRHGNLAEAHLRYYAHRSDARRADAIHAKT